MHTHAPAESDRDYRSGPPDADISFRWSGYYEQRYFQPLALVAILAVLYALSSWLLIISHGALVKVSAGIMIGLCCGKFSVIGHDACHGSYTPSRLLNLVIGHLALGASFHVYSAWKHWHNRIHHAYTNLVPVDFVWPPLSPDEFCKHSTTRRKREVLYRHHSGCGLGLYYLIEVLVPRMLSPGPVAGSPKRSVGVDSAMSYIVLMCPILFFSLASGPPSIGHSLAFEMALNLACGWLIPLLLVCWEIGFVVYFNHTHPDIRWFNDESEWARHQAQTECTVYMRFSGLSEFLLPNKVMNHVVHHVNPRVPAHYLRRAQIDFLKANPTLFHVVDWSFERHRDIMRRCKLYDFENKCWSDFAGRPTGPKLG
jgi:acyl-lipid omega-6 desaturase (Delta-12 desaturase)